MRERETALVAGQGRGGWDSGWPLFRDEGGAHVETVSSQCRTRLQKRLKACVLGIEPNGCYQRREWIAWEAGARFAV